MNAITTALISVAVSGLTEYGQKAMSEAYRSLKESLQKKNSNLDKNVKQLESDPYSTKLHELIENNIKYSGVDRDLDVRKLAIEVIESQKDHLRYHEKREQIGNLWDKVSVIGQDLLMCSSDFHENFKTRSSQAYVICVDIRRSTDLMLKSRSPQLFAEFIVHVSNKLHELITKNFGIVDKSTGDGIIGYFPDFYSGNDAGYLCLNAAEECHAVFTKAYKEHRKCFSTVLADIGLGIGVDYGTIHVEQIDRRIVVVGSPIVYANRLSNAEAGHTLVNQSAYELLFKEYSSFFNFSDSKIEIKHEGSCWVYDVTRNAKKSGHKLPDWALVPAIGTDLARLKKYRNV